jgi:hypothetical protein
VQWQLRLLLDLTSKHVLVQTPPSDWKVNNTCSWQRCTVITIQVQLQDATVPQHS